MSGKIHITKIGDHAGLIEIDNPPANALGSAARKRLLEAFDSLEASPAIRAIGITGTGKSFCGGDNLKEQLAAQSGGIEARRAQLGEFAAVLDRIEASRLPILAAVNGWAVGGGLELALACDIRIASTDARFVCAGVNVGLMASAWRLPKIIGVGPAKYMLLTGIPQKADAAWRMGLVSEVVGPDELINRTQEILVHIAHRAPLSVEATKKMASVAGEITREEALRRSAHLVEQLAQSADHAEALEAFAAKRDPKFQRK